MKRRSGTLYELGRERLGSKGKASAAPRLVTPEHQRPESGASAKLPVGLLAVGAGGLLIIAAVVWWIGFSVPPNAAAVLERGPTGQAQPPGHVIDPLLHPPSPEPIDAPNPVMTEPREDGRWYFVLAETRPEGARRLAAYCRAQGLDAAVISGHNTRLERVIALPGLDSASTTTSAYRALDDRIRDVGRRWKASGGTTFLSDRYLDRKKTKP